MNKLLVLNAQIVNEDQNYIADILVDAYGRIAQIGQLSGHQAATVLDAAGKTLLPGMIDDQVHFREPGLTHKGDIWHESRAAVAGGITSFMDMPNTKPATLTLDALEEKYARAAQVSLANYAFYLGASNDNLEVIRRLNPRQACGIKVFMGASTGNMLVDDPTTLEGIFREAPTLLAAHCENTPMISANEAAARAEYGENVPMHCHPRIRSREACYASSSLAVSLAKQHNTRLHVLHITTADELALFSTAPLADKRITAEVCVHHLFFADDDYTQLGAQIKCNPAVKTAADRAALREALSSGQLDIIGTDHAPHTWAEKQQSYFQAPSGLPLVQYALPALLELYHDGVLSLNQIARKTAHNVADLFQIEARGYLREGYWADFVLVDLNNPNLIEREDNLSLCGWSPFEGYTLRSQINATVVSGELAYQAGEFLAVPMGQRLQFNR